MKPAHLTLREPAKKHVCECRQCLEGLAVTQQCCLQNRFQYILPAAIHTMCRRTGMIYVKTTQHF